MPRRGGRPATRWCRQIRTNSTAPRRCRACAPCAGTRSIGVSTDGLSRLMVGGATPSRIARIEKIASTAPAAPSRCPMQDLVDDIEILPAALPTTRSTAPSSIVVGHGRGAVGVDVVDLGGRDAGALDRGASCSGTRRRRPRDGAVMWIGVARQPVADQFGVDLRAARLGVLVLLQHHARPPPRPSRSRRAPCRRGARPWCGVSLKLVDSARQAAKPAIDSRLIGDSVPPATITSASPSAISRAASPIACAPVEQAVTTAWFGPFRPNSIDT